MIRLIFLTLNRKIIRFVIENKVVVYNDSIWNNVQLYPLDKELVKRLAVDNKVNLRIMADLIVEANTGDNLKQYENCTTDEEVAEIIRKDCKLKGLKEIKT